MKAFLTLWDDDIELRRTKVIDCKQLIVCDGCEFDIDGEKTQLFNVVASEGITQNVAVIEIL